MSFVKNVKKKWVGFSISRYTITIINHLFNLFLKIIGNWNKTIQNNSEYCKRKSSLNQHCLRNTWSLFWIFLNNENNRCAVIYKLMCVFSGLYKTTYLATPKQTCT